MLNMSLQTNTETGCFENLPSTHEKFIITVECTKNRNRYRYKINTNCGTLKPKTIPFLASNKNCTISVLNKKWMANLDQQKNMTIKLAIVKPNAITILITAQIALNWVVKSKVDSFPPLDLK